MSVEVEQKDEEVYKAKRADKLREYYFPTKENSNPTQQETGKIPTKRPSLVSSVDPNQLPQVNYSTLGIDIDQLDSTISFNVESFVNDTLGEFGWNDSHELDFSQKFNLNLDGKSGGNPDYVDNQCLELIQKAYKNNNLISQGGKIIDKKENSDDGLLEKIQNDFDSLKVITETVETIKPRNQIKDNLTAYCKKINKPDSVNEYSEVCDIIRELSHVLKQVESNYIDDNLDNEAFALIAFYRLRQMEVSGMTKEHLNVLNDAINSFENKASPREFEKLKIIQKFTNFIGEQISS